jgi:hypothetical protein
VEPSRDTIVELGGSAERERWGRHDGGDDTDGGWDEGRRAVMTQIA